MASIHICYPKLIGNEVRDLECKHGICGKVTPHHCRYFEWYGPSVTCLGCGESYQDGERCERPFARGWRKKSIQHSHKHLNDPVQEIDLG